ncbi:MFS transporter [Chloroflexota bacterium]
MAETNIYRNHNFLIACGVNLMGMMCVAVIVPAFPQMVDALGIGEQSIGLVITAFTLPGFLFAPLAGIMADRFGRKRLLVPCLLLFGVFGGGCALAPDLNTLLILRVLHGIAGAPLIGIATAIIGDLYSGQQRVEAMGLNTTIMYSGYIVHPIIGGALAGFGWHYAFLPFLVSIPLGLIALLSLNCPEPESKQTLKEYLGDALGYMKSLTAFWLFAAVIVTYILLYGGYLTYFGILLDSRFHASAFIIGLHISVVGLMTAIAASQVGRLNKRFSIVSIIIVAFIIYACATALIPVMPNLWLCFIPTIIFGIAHGLNLPGLQVIAASMVPLEHRAGFMNIFTTFVMLGMTVAPPITGLAFSLTGLKGTFIIVALIALIIPVMGIAAGKKRLTYT